MFLKRFSHPCRYSDMIARFPQPTSQIWMITNMSHIDHNFLQLLSDFN